jgi:hypothetical protein
MNPSSRDGFTSSFGVLLATLGSAVGLGNIWKFPSLTGMNGGAGFLLVYLLATLTGRIAADDRRNHAWARQRGPTPSLHFRTRRTA